MTPLARLASGERFVFLTTEESLRPGVIALLNLLR